MSLRIPIALLALLTCASSSRPAQAPEASLYDCNGNGIEDAVDIAYGSSADANKNGIPDECERTGTLHQGL